MARIGLADPCACVEGQYWVYPATTFFAGSVVERAEENARIIFDCYSGDPDAQKKLLAKEQRVALRALRHHRFFQRQPRERRHEQEAAIQAVFQNPVSAPPDSTDTNLRHPSAETLLALASRRGAKVRECFGENTQGLEQAYKAILERGNQSDARPVFRRVYQETLSGQMPEGYELYDRYDYPDSILEKVYRNSLLLRKAYGSDAPRLNARLMEEVDVLKEFLNGSFPDKRQDVDEMLKTNVDLIFWLQPFHVPTLSKYRAYRNHSVKEVDLRDVSKRALVNGGVLRKNFKFAELDAALDVEKNEAVARLASMGIVINPEISNLLDDLILGRKKASDLPPRDPAAHRSHQNLDLFALPFILFRLLAGRIEPVRK